MHKFSGGVEHTKDIKNCEDEMDDDAESIITNERFTYIAGIISKCYKLSRVAFILDREFRKFEGADNFTDF